MNKELIEVPLGKRNNYFYGKLLSAEDFNDEQTYFRNRMQLHNRMLHGYGIVSGLDVSSDDHAASIVVDAGAGIDARGNEVIVPSQVKCPLPEGALAYLVIGWTERGTDPVPALAGTDGGQPMPSRIEEYAVLKYQPDHKDAARDGIVLARLKKVRGKWKVDKKFRRRRAKP